MGITRSRFAFSFKTLLKPSHWFLLFLMFCPLSFAADPIAQPLPQQPNVLAVLAVLFFIGLVPYLVILLTSFTKIVIVMSLLRNALGVQQAPPNQVITGIALILTTYIMFPTGYKMYNEGKEFFEETQNIPVFAKETPGYMLAVVNKTKEPLRDFLLRNTLQQQLKNFYQTAYRVLPEEYKESLSYKDFLVIMPAYIISQLKGAFEIGVLIYLPFFVIDLVTSNILLAMGMMMLSPLTIALPLKLLLLVMVDGWSLLVQGLVLTYR